MLHVQPQALSTTEIPQTSPKLEIEEEERVAGVRRRFIHVKRQARNQGFKSQVPDQQCSIAPSMIGLIWNCWGIGQPVAVG